MEGYRNSTIGAKWGSPQEYAGHDEGTIAQWAIGQTLNDLGGLTRAEIAFAERLYPGFQRNLQRAIGAARSAASTAPVESFGLQARGQAFETGMDHASRLRASGLGSGVQQGAVLNAMNQANRATNQFRSQLFDPMYQAQAANQAATLGSPVNRMQIPQMTTGLGISAYGTAGQVGAGQPKKKGFLDTVLDIGSAVVPFF